jgi:23S rRNA (guanosine2251-2'-O)-methyltransferase
MERYVILHNIRSAHNVGSFFRTSDAAGVTKIFLTGYTPAPIDRFGRPHKEIVKTSLGATECVPHAAHPDIFEVLSNLEKNGVHIVAVEQTKKAIPYTKFSCSEPTAFVFGNEVTGIEPEILEQVTTHVHIPMSGTKESLNVSVCGGVILFHARDGG